MCAFVLVPVVLCLSRVWPFYGLEKHVHVCHTLFKQTPFSFFRENLHTHIHTHWNMIKTQQEHLVPRPDDCQLREMHGIPEDLASALMHKKLAKNERQCFSTIRKSLGQHLRVSDHPSHDVEICVQVAGLPAVVGSLGILCHVDALSFSKNENLYIAPLHASMPSRAYDWDRKPLGILRDKDPVYVRKSELDESRHLFQCASGAAQRMVEKALQETGRILRCDKVECRERGFGESHWCLAFVKATGKKLLERTIISAIIFDRRPIIQAAVSARTVYDMLASGRTFYVDDVMYLMLCRRVEEHRLQAYRMDAFCDALDEITDETLVTPDFKELVRELQPLYVPDPWKQTNVGACAEVLRRRLAHFHTDQLADVNWRNVVLEFFHAEIRHDNYDGTSYLSV